jgi:hypothetical protein
LKGNIYMNTKMKLSVLAGALALAVAGQANAAIVTTGGFANDLVLSVWDATNNTSYTANLGVTMQSILTGTGVTFGGTAKAPAITGVNDTNNFSFTDTALTSFLATASANTSWSVIAVNTPSAAYGTTGVMTTSTSPLSALAAQTTANLLSMSTVNNAYLGTVSVNMGTANSYATTAALGGLAFVGAAGNVMGNNLGGNLNVLDTAAIGSSQNFFFLTPNQNARGVYAGATAFQFANATGASTLTLTSAGLTYSSAAVAAVPEPGEWLLMLSGLALIGFIATRRKEEGSVTFA